MKIRLILLKEVLLFLLISFYCNYLSAQQEIKSVKIGRQVWTRENLNVSTFRNGDPIFEAKSDSDWAKAAKEHKPAWCYYNNTPDNGIKYGKLYNWYAINDRRGLAPKGWHIPTYKNLTHLINYLGKKYQLGEKMKSTTGWKDNGNGDNSSGFSAFPGGYRWAYGAFDAIGKYSYFWLSREYLNKHTNLGWRYSFDYNNSDIHTYSADKGCGFSVRCIKN